jgi:hypothetical protein
MTSQVEVWISVEFNCYRLSRPYSVELAFLKIRRDPNLRRND